MFVFKYASGVHHYGLFFIAIVMALWMAEGAPAGPRGPRPLLSRRAFTVAMLIVLLPSLYKSDWGPSSSACAPRQQSLWEAILPS